MGYHTYVRASDTCILWLDDRGSFLFTFVRVVVLTGDAYVNFYKELLESFLRSELNCKEFYV